jgi:hypothetical protein
MEPWKARVICATAAEAKRIEALLRVYPEPGRGDDPLDAAYGLVENIYEPGSVIHRSSPVLLARNVADGDRFEEVFISVGCWDLSPDQLVPAVRATRAGMHLVR